jgi:hypothetical protein
MFESFFSDELHRMTESQTQKTLEALFIVHFVVKATACIRGSSSSCRGVKLGKVEKSLFYL